MDINLIEQIQQSNPWVLKPDFPILSPNSYINRAQSEHLLKSDWDKLWSILIGPRQAGKTTLGKYVCQELIKQKRFTQLLYLNCDYSLVRQWLQQPTFLNEGIEKFNLENFILFIDEVQRLENPGLLLKIIVDLQLPIKLIASGSSQLEIKSKIQEHLTGRQLETLILPLSCQEIDFAKHYNDIALFGAYPQVYKEKEKQHFIQQLYNAYIAKDIIEFLKLAKPDALQKLISLLAHTSGQLVNHQQLATDCQINITTLQHYLDVLEKTYIIYPLKPFVGNKRTELTSNPIYYFIDNGFRNHALNNFSPLANRTDCGLLIEGLVFQEILKFKAQSKTNFDIHYWRTKGGAEVDFVIYQNKDNFMPIEVKYSQFKVPKITRGFRSFIEAYQPKQAVIINKNLSTNIEVDGCTVSFIPLAYLNELFSSADIFSMHA